MSQSILTCKNLCKSYTPGKPVLYNLNISLSGGKIVGLLGPNGCGKSTLLKLISGILVPDSGSIEICGIPRSEETNSFISYLPERTYFNPQMRVCELISYFREFFPDFDEECARRMLADLSIDTDAKLRTLSKGTKEKVQLVLVMARRAKLYLLDEPIAGVDPAAREYILDTIITHYRREATVVISTHLITDVEKVLDSFVFIRDGKLLMKQDVESVRESGKTVDELFREVYKCL